MKKVEQHTTIRTTDHGNFVTSGLLDILGMGQVLIFQEVQQAPERVMLLFFLLSATEQIKIQLSERYERTKFVVVTCMQ